MALGKALTPQNLAVSLASKSARCYLPSRRRKAISGSSVHRLRDQFSAVWEVSSLSLRIHMVEEGMGVTFLDRKMLREHPVCATFHIMDDVSFGRIDKQVGLYYRAGKDLSNSAWRFIGLCQGFWNL